MKFQCAEVQQHFSNYPDKVRNKLLAIRELIYEVSLSDERIGELEETLKWNEPSYLTSKTNSGTAIRMDWKSKNPNQFCIYFNCKTTLVETFRQLFPELCFEGNRAIIFQLDEEISKDLPTECFFMALTYKLQRKRQ